MNTQKLLIFVFILSMFIGIGMELEQNINKTPENVFGKVIESGENYESTMKDESTIWGGTKKADDSIQESTIGNTIKMGVQFMTIMSNGLNPFSITPNMYESNIEKAIVYVVILFRTMVTLLVGLELYMVIKNQKQS